MPVSITVAKTAPFNNVNRRRRRGKTGSLRFICGFSSTAVSVSTVTDDESAGSGEDKFGALRDSVKRN